MFNNVDPQGNPTTNIVNQLVNFGWEYVYHCHILSHEEMDMMRPVSVALPPIKPDRLEFSINGSNLTLTWWDNSITETAFQVQRTTAASGWQTITTIASPLGQPNIHEQRSYTDTTFNPSAAYQYRVVALNTVGYGGAYPSLTAQSVSDPIAIGTPLPPVVTSSVRQNPNPTNLSTVNFLVTFSEPVTGVDAADFALSVSGGIAGHSITSVNPTDTTGATYTVAVNTGTGDGAIRLDVVDDNSILNGFSVPLGGAAVGDGNFSTGENYDIDKTQPVVSTIARSSANPSNAATVWFAVTFSEPVTGVSAADFALIVTGGVINASVTSVTGTGATRNVAVNTGTGSGTLNLELPGTATVTDLVGNQLTGLPFSTAGQEYTVYQTVPTVISILRASPDPTNAASVDYTVTFSEAVTGVDPTDFAFTFTGSVNGASITSVNDPAATGTTYTVAVNTGTGSGTLRLDLMDNNSIQNAATIPLGGMGTNNYTSGEIYTFDRTSPTVVSSVRASPNPTNAASVNYTVTFTEPVTGVDTTDFAITVSGAVTGASVTSLSQADPNQPVYTVVVNTGTDFGTLRLDVMDNNTIIDALGNPLGGAGVDNYTIGQTYNLDKTPPSVASIVRAATNPTNAVSVDYTVTFSEAVTGVDAADFALNVTGGITGAAVTGVSGSGTTYTVAVNTGTGSGTLRLDAPGSATAADLVGNVLGSLPFTGGQSYDIDKTPPTIVSSVRASVNPTGATSVNYTVTFSEPVTGVDAADFALTAAAGITGAAVTGVSGSGTTYTIAVSTGSGTGTLRLDIAGSAAITDTVGNPLGSLPFISGESYLKTVPMGKGIYDDANAAWIYSGSWSTYTGTGPYQNTMHYTNVTDATASFVFAGPAKFVLSFQAASNRGDILVSVDGGTPFPVNAYSPTGIWQKTYTSPMYADPGSHTVTFSTPGTGKFIDVDSIQIVSPLGAGKYDDANTAWTYNGTWSTWSGTGPYQNTMHYANATGTTAQFTFQAPARFVLNYSMNTNRGNMLVSVDGGAPVLVNTYNASNLWQQSYSSSMYSDTGIHTVTISTPGDGKYIDVDAIQIIAPLGAGKYDDMNTALAYGGSWSTYTGTGPYQNTMHYTNATGATASFTFQSPAQFILSYQAASNRSDILVSVDGGAPILVNAYSATGLWQQTYTSPMYSGTGVHTVTISTPGTGKFVDVDAIQIVVPMGAGKYDDADPAWTYSGSWLTYNGTGPYQNTMHYTNATGATATFVFQGPAQFTLSFQTASNRSDILVSVDGGAPVLVNAYSATGLWQQTYTSPMYSGTGTHTVTISTPGGAKYIDVDAITITP